ncbi:acyl-CoA dehydrogenase (acd-9) [marine actinobacterium PHSC20C1]|nr:acyl-CoA dehydrogenase (acd-9) [marine actinobacterium PHSC20C1]
MISLGSLGTDLDELRQVARAFADREIESRVDEAESAEHFPTELFRLAGANGFIGSHYPVDVGGGGGGIAAAMVLREEFSYSSVGISSGLGHQDHVGTAYLHRFGSPEQIDRWLRPALAGEFVIAMAVTEPDAGSDVRRMRSKARREGNEWVITGRKTFITNGPLADGIAIVVRLADTTDRFGVFVVLRGDPGYQCERTLGKMGCNSSEVGELVFDDVRVGPDRMLSPEGGSSLEDVLDVLVRGRVLVAASALGLARRAFDVGMEYAKQREAFGRPIGRFQEISMKFADASTAIRAAHLITYDTAALLERDSTVPVLECSQAKLFASETAVMVVDQMMRVFGGAGFMQSSVIERLYRDARFFTIVEGTVEIQHRIISSHLGL